MDPDLKLVAVVAGCFYVFYLICLLLYGWSKRNRTEEQKNKVEQKTIQEVDELLKAKDDPNEPARWVP